MAKMKMFPVFWDPEELEKVKRASEKEQRPTGNFIRYAATQKAAEVLGDTKQ